jgi:hypothetical protein
MLKFLKRLVGAPIASDARTETADNVAGIASRDEVTRLRGEFRDGIVRVENEAATVRQGLTAELERVRDDIAAARRELETVRQTIAKVKTEAVILVRQELLTASSRPVPDDSLRRRVNDLERIVMPRPELPPASSRHGTPIDLTQHEWGNKIERTA